jgi:hypothetical protein
MRTAAYGTLWDCTEGTEGYGAVRGALAVIGLSAVYSIMDRF